MTNKIAAYPAVLTIECHNGFISSFDMSWASNGQILAGTDGVDFDSRMGEVYASEYGSPIEKVVIYLKDAPTVRSEVSANSDPKTGLYTDRQVIATYAAGNPPPVFEPEPLNKSAKPKR